MNWKSIELLPQELINEDVFLRFEMRLKGDIVYAVGSVTELGDVYAFGNAYFDGTDFVLFEGFIGRDEYKNVFYVDPREIKL